MDSHHSEDDFLSGANAIFIAEMHQRWQNNPDSVDQDWADFFNRLDGLDKLNRAWTDGFGASIIGSP